MVRSSDPGHWAPGWTIGCSLYTKHKWVSTLGAEWLPLGTTSNF